MTTHSISHRTCKSYDADFKRNAVLMAEEPRRNGVGFALIFWSDLYHLAHQTGPIKIGINADYSIVAGTPIVHFPFRELPHSPLLSEIERGAIKEQKLNRVIFFYGERQLIQQDRSQKEALSQVREPERHQNYPVPR